MPERYALLISPSSFGAVEVRRHGQRWFARLAEQAGTDGIEVRGELSAPGDMAARLQRIHSSPEGRWSGTGVLDPGALARGLHAPTLLDAPPLKMPIGGLRPGSADSVMARRDRVADPSVEQFIETDQTATAATPRALTRFFDAEQSCGPELGMTFDFGNCHWTGERPLQAASALASRVRCMGVQPLPQRRLAVPIADSAAPRRGVLGAMPRGVPWATEYPLAGDDLHAVTRHEVERMRVIARSLE